MASLNLAYEHGDPAEIERLVVELGQDPEAIVGEDVASRIEKANRRISQLRRRLAELQLEMDAQQKSKGFCSSRPSKLPRRLAQTLWVTWRMNWPRKSPSARPN